MKQPISQLREWFSRHKFPTQNQFWDLFDSYWHKDEPIPAGQISGLQQIFDGATEGFGEALAAKQDKQDNNLQTNDKTVAGAINELNERANSVVETGQPLAVSRIVDDSGESLLLTAQLSPVLTANSSIAGIVSAYNADPAGAGIAGNLTIDGDVSVTTSSKPAGYTRGLKLQNGGSLEFTELQGGVIKNLVVMYYAGGSNRLMNIYVDGALYQSIPLVSSGHQVVEIAELGAGDIKIQHGGSSSWNLWEVSFEVEVTSPAGLPEVGADGERIIQKEAGEDNIYQYSVATESWNAETSEDGTSVRVAQDNYNEYVKQEGRFIPREKQLREWIKEIDIAVEIAENDIEDLREQIESLPPPTPPADLSGLIPKSDFNGILPYGYIINGVGSVGDGAVSPSPAVSMYMQQFRSYYNSAGTKVSVNTSWSLMPFQVATATKNGLMTPAMYNYLYGIQAGAQVNEVTAASLAQILTNYLTEEEVYNAINEAFTGLLTNKGTVPTRADLPVENVVEFDLYHIDDENLDVYARTIDGVLTWQPLNFTVDLSQYETVAGAIERAAAVLAEAKDYADAKKAEAISAANAYTDGALSGKQDVIESFLKSIEAESGENSFTVTSTTKELQEVPDDSEGAEPGATVITQVETQKSVTLVAGNGVSMEVSDDAGNKTVTLTAPQTAEQLPQVDRTEDVNFDAFDNTQQNIEFDFLQGNVLIIPPNGLGDTSFPLNIIPTNVQVGDVRYFTIDCRNSNFNISLSDILVDGIPYDNLNASSNNWNVSDQSPASSEFEYKCLIFKFVYLTETIKYIELTTISRQ